MPKFENPEGYKLKELLARNSYKALSDHRRNLFDTMYAWVVWECSNRAGEGEKSYKYYFGCLFRLSASDQKPLIDRLIKKLADEENLDCTLRWNWILWQYVLTIRW